MNDHTQSSHKKQNHIYSIEKSFETTGRLADDYTPKVG